MGRKGPEDVFLPPYFSEVQAIGVYVVDPPQVPRHHQRFKRDESRMIFEQMADHEHPALGFCDIDELPALVFVQNQRLFHKDMFAGEKRLPGNDKVGLRGSGHLS